MIDRDPDEYFEEAEGYLGEVAEDSPPFGVWLREWVQTRHYLHLAAGVPALLALAGLVALTIYLLGWQAAGVEARLRPVAERAFAGQDYETARVAYQSLLRLGGKQAQEYAFQLLRTEMQLGRGREAAALTLQLAPPRRAGYAPAHFLVARLLLAETNAPEGALEQAASHLERTLRAEPANTEARELVCQIYLSSGRKEQARRHLLVLAPASGEAMLRLATLLAVEGDASGARHWAERAAQFFRPRVGASGSDELANRLALAGALRLLEDYPAAFEVLEAGWQVNHHEGYRPAMAGICGEWAQFLARHRPADVAERFQAVAEGLDLDPKNPALLQQLAKLSIAGGPAGEPARALVAQMLNEGRNTGLLHFCLGAEAWERGEREKAFEHFRLAYAVAPNLPLVANNMAMTLALQEKPELDRALAIMESVVQSNPRNAAFRETRGQILLKRGKHREALADLAFALPLIADKAATHRAIAECYRQMGLADLAAQHESAARGTQPPATAPGPTPPR